MASVRTALVRLQEEPGLRHRLWSNANQLCNGLKRAGFTLGPQVSPIAAIHMPDTAVAVAFWNQLMDRGIYVNLVLPPATPDERPLLRASVTAAHDRNQIEAAIASFTETAATLGMRLGTAEPALQN